MFIPFSESNTTTSSIVILPEVGSSNPAIILKVVVLPQPDGPKRVIKDLSSITIDKFSTATNFPNFFVTFSNTIFGIIILLFLCQLMLR